MAAIKIAVLLLGLATSGAWAKECSKISDTGIFEDNTCKNLCKDDLDEDKHRFRNSEKGGAFSFDCFCGADFDKEACADKDFDVNAMPTDMAWRHFGGGFSPMALGAALLLAVLRA